MLFVGREREVSLLQSRLVLDGLTVLVARPLMGKTSLAHQSIDGLGTTVLSGWAESTGEHSDLLLRALSNLYTSWLANSSYREQAIALWRTRQRDTTKALAGFMKEILGIAPMSPPALTKIVTGLLEGLVKTNDHLRHGVVVPRLSYDVAKDLVTLIYDLSKRRLVLVLDSFERSPAFEEEQLALATFLRKGGWQGVHLLVLSRDECIKPLRRLASESPAASLIELKLLQLSGDDSKTLLAETRKSIEAARDVSDEQLLALIDGYPGVIHWWLDRPDHSSLSTVNDLIEAAHDAHANRYRNLGELIRSLPMDGKRLAARLAMLPQITSQSPNELSEFFLWGRNAADIERLQADGVFDPGTAVPSFGHPTRHDAVVRLFETDEELRPVMALEVRQAIERLIDKIDYSGAASGGSPMILLIFLRSLSESLDLASEYQLACQMAIDWAFLPLNEVELANLAAWITPASLQLAPLMAKTFTGFLDVANLNPLREYHQPLLTRIEFLVQAFPNAKMRRMLADSYANALNYDLLYDNYSSRDMTLAKLRSLTDSYRDEPELLDCLIRSLSQSIGRELGADISSPELLFVAAMQKDKEAFERLSLKAKRRPLSRDIRLAAEWNSEIRRRAGVKLDRKPVRDFLLITILRWIKLFPEPDLEEEYQEIKTILDRFSQSQLVRRCYAESVYACLIRDLLDRRLDRRDFWLSALRLIASDNEFGEEAGYWLFIATLDAAEYTAIITENPEEAQDLFLESDATARRFSEARAGLGRISFSRVLAGISYGDLDLIEHGIGLLASAFDEFPDDPEFRGLLIAGIGETLEWNAEVGKHRDLLSTLAHNYNSHIKDVYEYLEHRHGRHSRKRIKKQIRDLLLHEQKRPKSTLGKIELSIEVATPKRHFLRDILSIPSGVQARVDTMKLPGQENG